MEAKKLEVDSQIKEWVEERKSLRIFVFGKPGVGKSSLINTLLGIDRAKEGASLYLQTKGTESFTECRSTSVQLTINDVEVTIWDSPGLKYPYNDVKLIIEEIQKNCKDIDIFIYCIQFTQIKITQYDFDLILALSNSLGHEIWDKALIALTFANNVCLPPSSQDSLQEHFRKCISGWSEALRYAITKAGVKKENAEAVPIIPASYRDIPLPAGTTEEDWISVFWRECLQRSSFLSLPAILQLQREKKDKSSLVLHQVKQLAVELKQKVPDTEHSEIQEQLQHEQGDRKRLLELLLIQMGPTYFSDSFLHSI